MPTAFLCGQIHLLLPWVASEENTQGQRKRDITMHQSHRREDCWVPWVLRLEFFPAVLHHAELLASVVREVVIDPLTA